MSRSLLLALLLLPGLLRAGANTLLVDDFDAVGISGSYNVYGENVFGNDATSLTSEQVFSPPRSRSFMQSQTGGQGWGIILVKTFDQPQDFSAYNQLQLRFFSENDDPIRTLDVKLVFDNGAEWVLKAENQVPLADALNQFILVSLPLSEFVFTPEVAGSFDLSAVTDIGFLLRNNGQGSAARKVYFDDILLSDQLSVPTTIQVDAAEIAFGDIDPIAAGQNRFSSESLPNGAANLSWTISPGANWEIQIYTQNPLRQPALLNAGGAGPYFLPLKICTTPGADPNDPATWANTFLWVFDPTNDGAGPGSDGFLITLASSGLFSDNGSLPFWFGLDVQDLAFPDAYTGTVTFDFLVTP